MKLFVLAFQITICISLFGQKKDTIPDLSKGNYIITNLAEDTLGYKDRASQTLRMLRNGAVIVRLKTSSKSVDAYRKAGQNEIADRIEADRRKQNEKMYRAFERSFTFCRVYFIYAKETDQFLKGDRGIFLNSKLEHDPAIVLNDTNFVFCEYGSAESFSKFQNQGHNANVSPGSNGYEFQNSERSGSFSPGFNGQGTIRSYGSNKILDTIPTKTATSPATTSGLFFSDKNLEQLHRPFPFVEAVYMDNYDAPLRALSRELERAYGRLVIRKDFNEKIKQEKKEAQKAKKEKKKTEPKTKWIDY